MKILVVIDMQNDFIDGALGTKEAQAIVPKVAEKIKNFDGKVFYTRDTHDEKYLETHICVISNAMILKAFFPDKPIIVDAACCAGSTPEGHKNALAVMKTCQIQIENEE